MSKNNEKINNTKFPDDFIFGCATAAYQIEGGWSDDGKGESHWDRWTHCTPSLIANSDNADIACDSYHKYKEDVALLRNMGAQFYRFSISWPRILPDGLVNKINEPGVQYYRDLISELKQNNILPFATLYHWDLPQKLSELGGWTNPWIISWFTDYARLCFQLFGDDLKHWMTINEPKQVCYFSYGAGLLAPGVCSPGVGEYLAVHNVIRAHAEVYHVYKNEFKCKQEGMLGIVVDSAWFEPEDPGNPDDVEAVNSKLSFSIGIYLHPMVYGDYPDIVKEKVKRRSEAQGFKRSRLPEFAGDEKVKLKKCFDFIGLNYYTSGIVKADYSNPEGRGCFDDSEAIEYQAHCWESCALFWLKVVPKGIRNLLKWLTDNYERPLIYITENGYADNGGLEDNARISYIKRHLSQVKDAIDLDKCNVKGYAYWSLLDNFEWREGFKPRMGLISVDYKSPCRRRTPKKSAEYYKKVISARAVIDAL
nr:glycoside hydrolase family 1 [Phyllotreta armoraciae]